MKVLALVAVLALSACTSAPALTPAPQPTPITLPAPSPQVVQLPGITIEVAPASCVQAIDGLVVALMAENDVVTAYSNGKEPTAAEVRAFSAAADGLKIILDAATACKAAADAGS